jgi:hypothetical protein
MAQRNIQQIVKVLIGDTAVLQSGRRKKDKKKGKKSVKRKAPTQKEKKPPMKGGKPPRPPGGNLPKAPDGFLSQVFGPPKPPAGFPAPFISPAPSFYDRQKQEEADKRLARALQIIERDEKKETPGKITSGAPSFSGLSSSTSIAQSVFGSQSRPPMSRQPTTQSQTPDEVLPPAAQGVFGVPRTGFSIPSSATSVSLSSRSSSVATPMQAASAASSISPSVPSVSLSQLASRTEQLISQSQVGLEKAQSLRRTLSQGAQPAPNAGSQPSVDVDGEGKEAEELQPQQGAMTFVQAQPQLSPNTIITQHTGIGGQPFFEAEEVGASQASSSGVFGSAQASSSQAGAPSVYTHGVNLKIFGDSDEEEEEEETESDKQKRARLLQEAIDIETSLMPSRNINNIPPPAGAFSTRGNITAAGTRYLNKIVARIAELQRPGTPLHAIEPFKK